MAQGTVYPNGSVSDILVPSGSKIAIGIYGAGVAQVSYKSGPGNQNPDTYYFQQQVTRGETVLGTFSADRLVRIDAGTEPVFYNVDASANPAIYRTLPRMPDVVQIGQAAKTTSTTLTAAEIQTGIITVNQGGAGTSSLTLPLATAMDTALPDFGANDSLDFSVINVSVVAAENAILVTNTGWTIVGDLDMAANNAATTKSAGRFRARKTAAGAWTLYRLS